MYLFVIWRLMIMSTNRLFTVVSSPAHSGRLVLLCRWTHTLAQPRRKSWRTLTGPDMRGESKEMSLVGCIQWNSESVAEQRVQAAPDGDLWPSTASNTCCFAWQRTSLPFFTLCVCTHAAGGLQDDGLCVCVCVWSDWTPSNNKWFSSKVMKICGVHAVVLVR